MSRPEGEGPAYIIGGTYETGWPIDPADRLNDCVIAAADLGMFDPVRPLTAEQERTAPFRKNQVIITSRPHDTRDDLPWPIIETLPDGTESEFSPVGGQWIATRQTAFVRYGGGEPRQPMSIHAQFLWDLEHLLSAIIDTLTQEMADFGQLHHGHTRL